MGREIERKFLPANDGWRGLAQGRLLRQGYLCAGPTGAVRVRVAGERAWLGIKGRTVGASRAEFEYPIPLEDARQMLAELTQHALVEKTRYALSHGGLIWEVDEFHGLNQGLVLIEVELTSEDQRFARPAWVGEEVTDDPRYYNAALAARPFCEWKDE